MGNLAAGWERSASDSGAGHELSRRGLVAGWGIGIRCSTRKREKTGNVYRVNTGTGKMELSKTFGAGLAAGAVSIGGSYLSGDGGAYAYVYDQMLSQVYVVRGMK